MNEGKKESYYKVDKKDLHCRVVNCIFESTEAYIKSLCYGGKRCRYTFIFLYTHEPERLCVRYRIILRGNYITAYTYEWLVGVENSFEEKEPEKEILKVKLSSPSSYKEFLIKFRALTPFLEWDSSFEKHLNMDSEQWTNFLKQGVKQWKNF